MGAQAPACPPASRWGVELWCDEHDIIDSG